MTLRWVVEGKFSAAFTSTKKVKDEEHAEKKVIQLMSQNKREGYMKNSNYILYDDNNKIILTYA